MQVYEKKREVRADLLCAGSRVGGGSLVLSYHVFWDVGTVVPEWVGGYRRRSGKGSVPTPYKQMAKGQDHVPVTLIEHRRGVPYLTLSY